MHPHRQKVRFTMFILFALLIILAACQRQSPTQSALPAGTPPSAASPQDACIQACQDARAAGTPLISQCLQDPIPAFPDWVCDVAHTPRQPVDDQPTNQCDTFRRREARHFVEVTPDCQLIRSI